MIADNYFILGSDNNQETCGVWEWLERFDKLYRPARGVEMGDIYPSDVKFQMSKDKPGMLVSDYLDSALSYMMVTKRFKEVLEDEISSGIEYLPFTLLNHRGRVADPECYIVNVLGTIDCLDWERTEGEPDPMHDDRLQFIDKLFLLEGKIPENLKLFRLKAMPELMIIRKDLKDRLLAEGLTGMQFHRLEEELDL